MGMRGAFDILIPVRCVFIFWGILPVKLVRILFTGK